MIFSNCPAHFCSILPFLGETGIFPEKWQHHLKRLMVFYLYAQNYKKQLNGSKDSNLTIKQFLKYCQTLHPFLGVKEWKSRKKLSTSIRKYISRAIQIWNQIFKIFSSCVGYRHLKNVTVKGYLPIFEPFFPFFGKMIFFSEKWCLGQFIPLNAL